LRARLLLASSLALTLLALAHPAWAWSNGGYSTDPNNSDYGTHDWIAERALEWLPVSEKTFILTYRSAYLYGTELPDNNQAADGIGDTTLHHIYFFANGSLQDDAAARRAIDMQNQALAAISAGDYALAAKWTGAMTHYIADIAVFAHVMGSVTDWGSEQHHSDYEEHIQTLTDSPTARSIPVIPGGDLVTTPPYDAALALAYDTTFDLTGAGHPAVWMDQHYNWSDPLFTARAYTSINLAVMVTAAAVHATWSSVTTVTTTQQTAIQSTTTTTSATVISHVVINEVEQNPPGDDSNHEWLVLYNPTEAAVDIAGWRIQTTHGRSETYAIPAGIMLPPGGAWNVTFPGQIIDNEDESLVLLNAQGQVIDSTPTLTDTADDSNTWQRSPDGSDNWIYTPEFPWPMIFMIVALTLVLVAIQRRREVKSRKRSDAVARFCCAASD
jgi:hypothetical protein